MKDFKIFAGSSNLPLAGKIAAKLGMPLAKIEIVRFADSEGRVRIEEDVRGKICFVITSFSNPVDNHLMEFFLICDALKQSEAEKIIAVIPYFGYGRQDKAYRPGESISARVVTKLIETMSIERIVTIDLHSDSVASFFDIPVSQLFGLSIFQSEIERLKDDLVIVAPDAGGAKRAQSFAEKVNAPLAMVEKKRNLDKIHELETLNVIGQVKKKTCVIVDDIIAGGGTVIGAAEILKKFGAKKVFVCATHANFIDGAKEKLANSSLEKIFVSDTILVPSAQLFSKLKIVSVDQLLVEAIKKVL